MAMPFHFNHKTQQRSSIKQKMFFTHQHQFLLANSQVEGKYYSAVKPNSQTYGKYSVPLPQLLNPVD
jgi:hypothetical protein